MTAGQKENTELGLVHSQALQEQLHPLVNPQGLLAVRVYFLYQNGEQVTAGALSLSTDPGATVYLDQQIRARLLGTIVPTHRGRSMIPLHKKS